VSRLIAVIFALAACGEKHRRPPMPETPEDGVAPTGQLGGRTVRLGIEGMTIARIDATTSESGGVLWPPIVDSHVHLTYWPVADKLAASGIATVVDLSAPESALGTKSAINVIASGPMLTRPNGYPLESWGSDGYGIACADAACVTTAIDRMASLGARVVKIAMGDNGLDAALIPGAVKHAHARSMKVAVHALDNASAMLAATAGADLLAHTPAEPLAPATIEAWKTKAVISTLAAFGAPAAVDNLRALRAVGCTVLYGTDLGNLRDAGPSAKEIGLLREAGLDDAAITAAMTTSPATYWKLPAIAPGTEASFLLLEGDPTTDTRALLTPRGVWIRGRRLK
jgi:imidazolonepropionase-like amidohydrolase